jgi:hypothetical protein
MTISALDPYKSRCVFNASIPKIKKKGNKRRMMNRIQNEDRSGSIITAVEASKKKIRENKELRINILMNIKKR